jgi:Rrf2 family protein
MATNTRFATGIHALILLTREPGKLHSSETIAGKLNTNPVVIRRILAQLQQAGLVRNHKGPAGGSELIRPASKVTLADVYRVTDPGPLFSEATIKGAQAKRLTVEMRIVQESAEKALLDSLDKVSLEQLAKRSANK